jgi:hypothetical protein
MLPLLTTVGEGLSLYLLFCALTVAAGVSLVRLVRLQLPLRQALMLAPVLTLVLWTVGLGIGVSLGVPVRTLAIVLWLLTFGLAMSSLWGLVRSISQSSASRGADSKGAPATSETLLTAGWRSAHRSWGEGWLLAVCAALPVLVLSSYFRDGLADYPGSQMPDGLAYANLGQYLWRYSFADTNDAFGPAYQWAAANAGNRYIAASMLGLFSPFASPGDAQSATGLFLAWTLFVFAASCSFFGLAQGLKPLVLTAFLVLTVDSGWIYNVIWCANYDNVLALVYFPALAGTITLLKPQSWSWRIVLGLLGAALLYCYPELAPFVLGGTLLLLLNRCWQERTYWKSWTVTAGCGLVLMLVLAAPFLPAMYSFVRGQMSSVDQIAPEARPGNGFFPGLLQTRYQLAGFWGLGGEYGGPDAGEESDAGGGVSWLAGRTILGALLSILAAVGLLRLIRQRNIGLPLVLVLSLGGAMFFVARQEYDYGAYKLILLGWWAVCFALVSGMEVLFARLRDRRARALALVLCTLTVGCTLLFNHGGAERDCPASSKYLRLSMAEFRILETVKGHVGGAKLIVLVDDWLANEWAVYFLHDQQIDLRTYRMYLAEWVNSPPQVEAAPFEQPYYILTDDTCDGSFGDGQRWQLVWTGGPYRLWDPQATRWVMVTNIFAPPAAADDETVVVMASHPGVIVLPLIVPPDQAEFRLQITADSGYRREVVLDDSFVPVFVPVHAGENRITLLADHLPQSATPISLVNFSEGQSIQLLKAETVLPVRGSDRPLPARDSGGGEGTLDVTNDEYVAGWAWDRNQPDRPIEVDIFDGDTKVATVVANQFRLDLLNAGIGDGKHAFHYPTPARLKDGKAHTIHVKTAGTNKELTASPATVTLPAP